MATPRTQFAGLRFRIVREPTGAGAYSLPEWQPNARIVRLQVALGGTIYQVTGNDPAQIAYLLELDTDADVQTLWSLLGTTDTLRVRQGIGSAAGTAVAVQNETYRDIPNVTLTAVVPVGQALDGSFRVRATFEVG